MSAHLENALIRKAMEMIESFGPTLISVQKFTWFFASLQIKSFLCEALHVRICSCDGLQPPPLLITTLDLRAYKMLKIAFRKIQITTYG